MYTTTTYRVSYLFYTAKIWWDELAIVCFLHVVLPLIHPVRPVHLSVSGNVTSTKIDTDAIEQAIETAFVDTVDTKLHYALAATSETQLSTTHVASTPVEVTDTRVAEVKVINADDSRLGSDDEVSPKLVCQDIVVYGDSRRSVALRDVVRRVWA
jgi:hypothetical protein